MTLRVAIQMDHVSGLHIAGDTTFALGLAAQQREYELWHYEPDAMSLDEGRLLACAQPLVLRDEEGDHFDLGEEKRIDLADMDAILLRQDPPFDMNYITTTHLLERIHPDTLVVNDPAWVRNSPEKIFVADFPDLMPETLITRDRKAVLDFRKRHGDIILKPLYGNGGAGIFHLRHDDRNLTSLIELFEQMSREPYIVQRYLPAVRQGDKRIILIEGDPVGAINRVPAETDSRSNMHVGGRAEPIELTDRDREICERIGPSLRERGFTLVGIDVIGDVLTEINVTSPTGIREVKRFGGQDIAELFWDAVESRLSHMAR
ncbi:glutathione synthase [Notoacmeibacter marinus]|uniref:glutathione synthase n=1 Tax=Notoacmeibacter marinus TaxID=1876515 RepID=UPI000DF1B5DA|nr:glutathione synthase [Notoacmeibacter marinus]